MISPSIRLAALPLLCASLSAQTATHRTAASSTAHRAPVVAAKPACPIALPELSPKIPALPHPAECAKPLYTLAYVDTEMGTGELAAPHKYYTVHYTGYLPDGSKFDSSYDHPGAEPIVFPYGARQVIPGWDTGFEGMHVGGKRRLFIPYQLAYGEAGRPPIIPVKSELIFDVVFVGQSDTPPAPKTPPPAPAKPAESTPPAGASKPAATEKPATPAPATSTAPEKTSKPADPKP